MELINDVKTSKYWYFKTNDLSNEQYEHLKKIECHYITISNIDKYNKCYDAIIILDKSRSLSYIKKRIIYKNISENKYYLVPRPKNITPDKFIKHNIQENIRFKKDEHKQSNNKTEIELLRKDLHYELNIQKKYYDDKYDNLINKYNSLINKYNEIMDQIITLKNYYKSKYDKLKYQINYFKENIPFFKKPIKLNNNQYNYNEIIDRIKPYKDELISVSKWRKIK